MSSPASLPSVSSSSQELDVSLSSLFSMSLTSFSVTSERQRFASGRSLESISDANRTREVFADSSRSSSKVRSMYCVVSFIVVAKVRFKQVEERGTGAG